MNSYIIIYTVFRVHLVDLGSTNRAYRVYSVIFCLIKSNFSRLYSLVHRPLPAFQRSPEMLTGIRLQQCHYMQIIWARHNTRTLPYEGETIISSGGSP